jgi:hypothetical protein
MEDEKDKSDDRFMDDVTAPKEEDTEGSSGGELPKRMTTAPRVMIGDEVVFDPEDPDNEEHSRLWNKLIGEAAQKQAKKD